MIRIAWNIGWCGEGDWHPPSDRPALQAQVDDWNASYGPHTHWLEKSAPTEDSSVDVTEVVKCV